MVCLHTRSADRPANVLSRLDAIEDDLRGHRGDLLGLADADADAVDAMLDVPDCRSGSRAAKQATGVPLAIAESCLDVLTDGPFVVDQGAQNAVPDGVTGVLLTHRALQASIFIVRTNIGQIDDSTFRTEMRDRTTEIETSADEVYRTVIENGDHHHQ
jgi:formiminotetrahydrofolate cyclodeaminase